VLPAKIRCLRAGDCEDPRFNEQYRRGAGNEIQAQVAHGQRHERLQAIQQELGQLVALGRKVQSIEGAKEEHRSRLHPVKKVW
jgi:hypothetical protein